MAFTNGDVEYIQPGFGADASVRTPGYFSTPEDLLSAAQQTNGVIMALHAAVDENRRRPTPTIPKSVRDEWVAFVTGWSGYYETNFGGSRLRTLAHWFTSDLQGTLVNYQQQAALWADRLKKYGAKITGAGTEGKPGGAANVMMWVGIAVVGVVGLFIIGKLVHTVALGGAALEEAEDEALRIAEAKRRKRTDKTALSIA